jgi:HK97 family phage major capsid protein
MAVVSLLEQLESRRDALRTSLMSQLEVAQRSGRGTMTDSERRSLDDLRALDEHVSDLKSDVERSAIPANLRSLSESRKSNKMINDCHLTYRRGGEHSWLRDQVDALIPGHSGGEEARRRLAQHGDQVQTGSEFQELRDLSRVDGSGGYAVPPLWQVDQFISLARPHRAFADLCNRQPLPGGTDSINIPKVLSGTTTGIQTADNATISNTDLVDTFINAPVRTIGGLEAIALQLIEQSPINYLDQVILPDLIADVARQVDLQVLGGNGTSGQVTGIDFWPAVSTITVNSVDVPGIYSALANAVQSIHTTRFLPPTAIVMHPRRWGFLLAALDTQHRPLFLPGTNGLNNAAGVLEHVASEMVVGSVQGLPIVTDPNITTTASDSASGSGTEDVILVIRAQDLTLYESAPRAVVFMEPKAATMGVLVRVHQYLAFLIRYAQSVVIVGGLSAPTF